MSTKQRQACIMQIENTHMIVMTNDGEFLTLPAKGLSQNVGDIIALSEKNRRYLNKNVLAALSCAALILLAFLPFFTQAKPVVWVSVDVNPSIELGIDEEERIIATEAMNIDGQSILNNVKIQKMQLEDALPVILSEMQKESYITTKKENTVLLAFAAEKGYEPLQEKTTDEMKQVLHKLRLSGKIPLQKIYYLKGNLSQRQTAHKNKLSLGKYSIYQKAKAKGLKISISDLSVLPVSKAVYKAGVDISKFFPNNQKEETPVSQKAYSFIIPKSQRIKLTPDFKKTFKRKSEQHNLKAKEDQGESKEISKPTNNGRGKHHEIEPQKLLQNHKNSFKDNSSKDDDAKVDNKEVDLPDTKLKEEMKIERRNLLDKAKQTKLRGKVDVQEGNGSHIFSNNDSTFGDALEKGNGRRHP